jgi:hypothetical protein
MVAARMILFVLTGQTPAVLVVALLIFAYLTAFDLRDEDDLPFLWKAWWVLLVLLTHILGYAVFRIWLAMRRRSRRPA